jgi:hypothetical protein
VQRGNSAAWQQGIVVTLAALACAVSTVLAQVPGRSVAEILKGLGLDSAGLPADIANGRALDASNGAERDRAILVMRFSRPDDVPRTVLAQRVTGQPWTSRAVDAELGSPGQIEAFGDGWAVATHLNPSAGQVLVVDASLATLAVIQGYGPRALAPDLLIVSRNLMHFAPAHDEALLLYRRGAAAPIALYPPAIDGEDLAEPAEPGPKTPVQRTFLAATKAAAFDLTIDDESLRYNATTDVVTFAVTFRKDAPNPAIQRVTVKCTPVKSGAPVCAETAIPIGR